MLIKRLGDLAFLVEVAAKPSRDVGQQVLRLGEFLRERQLPDVCEVVPGLTALGVYLAGKEEVKLSESRLEEVLQEWKSVESPDPPKPRLREIQVQYGGWAGPDLERVAQAVGMSAEEVVSRHSARTYHVAALGFAPGFPYLTGMDPELACPRLPNPRLAVPAGSVGIGGEQTGVYPHASPGGWNLIGCTAQPLFDPEADEPAWLGAGDEVRFVPTERIPTLQIKREEAVELVPATEDNIEVEAGGVQATVQDLGRWGYQSLGVSVGGVVNRRAASVANLLVGNPAGSAVIEWALRGPRLRFSTDRLAAVTGVPTKGRPFARPFIVRAGETLDLTGSGAGGRGYLAVSGGLDVPEVMEGRGTHMAAGFGGGVGRALREGDRLPLGKPAAVSASAGWCIDPMWAGASLMEPVPIRIVRGPESDDLGEQGWQQLQGQAYTVSPDSNRMGIRLAGEAISMASRPEMISQPVAEGVVQLPPDGIPVILMADRQTLGGYPRIAAVVSVDLPKLAQTPIGQKIRFEEVSLDEADTLRRYEVRDLRLMATALRSRLKF